MDLTEQTERMQSFYNLKHDPFGAIVDAMVFSAAGGRYEIVETVRHLMTYSAQDSLLVAPSGSGKRTVALQVLKLLDEQWRVAWVDGSDLLTGLALIKELNGQLGLGLKVAEYSDQLLDAVIHSVAERLEEESFMLVVQYADQLPTEVKKLLLALRSKAQPEQRVRQFWLVDDWQELVKELPEEDWYLHALERLEDADAEQYLKDRLIAAGRTDDFPIPSKDVARLNQLADGNPSALNEAASDYLVSSTYKTTEKKQAFPLTHVLAGIAALALIGVAVAYKANETKTTLPELSKPPSAVNELTSVEQKLAEAVAKVEAKQSAQQAAASEPEVKQTEPEVQVAEPKQLVVAAENATENQTQDTMAEPESFNQAETAQQTVKATADMPVAQVEGSVKRESIIDVNKSPSTKAFYANAEASDFTMQLIGVYERQNLEKLLVEFPNDAQVEIIETKRDGKAWFILIYGLFSDKASAQAALNQVPESLGVQQPWIRSIGSIRQAS